jgi:hypothetical protein
MAAREEKGRTARHRDKQTEHRACGILQTAQGGVTITGTLPHSLNHNSQVCGVGVYRATRWGFDGRD